MHVAGLETDPKAAPVSIIVWRKGRRMLGNRLHGKALACAELSSNTPTMNSIAAETGLHVICLQIEVGHVAGVANYEADALSRQCQGKAFLLASSQRCSVRPHQPEMRLLSGLVR